ncbi:MULTISPECIES: hypothetical protein [unclassified Rhodococcus (in: high G+C Gram-positive bacteria)]|nr:MULTISPECIES: hypothetical protein [unclassified Rhodococcus (in: high G+C Gram-positive bacteria)]
MGMHHDINVKEALPASGFSQRTHSIRRRGRWNRRRLPLSP